MEPTSLITAAEAVEKASGPARRLLELVCPGWVARQRNMGRDIDRAHDRKNYILDELAKANVRRAADNQITVIALADERLADIVEERLRVGYEQLDPEWMNTFRGWAGDASRETTRDLLATILANQVRRPGRYSSAFLLRLRTLDTDVARGFQVISNMVFGEVGVVRIFGKLNDDPMLQRMGVRYDDFLSCQYEGLIDRDKEIKEEFKQPYEVTIADEVFRFTEMEQGAQTEVMKITPFGLKVWELMEPRVDDEYFRRCVTALAERKIRLERRKG